MSDIHRFLDALLQVGKIATAARLAGISAETAWSWLRKSRAGNSTFYITHPDPGGQAMWLHEHCDQIRGLLDETFVPSTGSMVHLRKAWAARERRRNLDRLIAESRARASAEQTTELTVPAYDPPRDPVRVAQERERQLVEAYRAAPRSNRSDARPWDRSAAAEGLHSVHDPHPGVKPGGFRVEAASDRPIPKLRHVPKNW